MSSNKIFEYYKIALETRNFEIELFWKRSNYFLVLNTLLYIALFKFNNSSNYLSLLIIVFGFFVSILWFCVNLGSKFWQIRWEEKLANLEQHLSSELKLFSTQKEPFDDVKNNIAKTQYNSFDKIINKLILKKFSVSRQMIYLSLSFILIWLLLFIIKIVT